jgi:hypothetical protein
MKQDSIYFVSLFKKSNGSCKNHLLILIYKLREPGFKWMMFYFQKGYVFLDLN